MKIKYHTFTIQLPHDIYMKIRERGNVSEILENIVEAATAKEGQVAVLETGTVFDHSEGDEL